MSNNFSKKFSELESIARSGAIAVLKIDGLRILAENPNVYTIILSGGELDPEEFFRMDGENIEELIEMAVNFYSSHKNSHE
jgi:hypothetical protein